MLPLLWWNYTIRSKMHSYSYSIITYNVRIMIIFLIWYLLLIISLMHCFCKIISFFSFQWIFILLVLPLFWNYNSIIPQIITHSITIIIFQFYIMFILFIRYLSFHSQSHSISSTITISIWIIIIFLTFPLTRNILTSLFQIIFNFLSIFIL